MYMISKESEERLKDGIVLGRECKREVANAIAHILASVGEDPKRDGLNRTPERVACMYDEILSGYKVDIMFLLKNALFDVEYEQMVLIKDIEFYSMCKRHLLPIYGKAHVAYIPNKKVVGLSKIPRIVDTFARRLQVQERMTNQIADFLDELIRPQGVGVVVDALHFCIAMRGVKKTNAHMRTSALLGSFSNDPNIRTEFFERIGM